MTVVSGEADVYLHAGWAIRVGFSRTGGCRNGRGTALPRIDGSSLVYNQTQSVFARSPYLQTIDWRKVLALVAAHTGSDALAQGFLIWRDGV